MLIIVSSFAPDSLKTVRSLTGRFIVPLQKGVNNIGEYVDDKMKIFGDIKALKEENEQLKQQISEYQKEINQNQAELTELTELRKLYDLFNSLSPLYNALLPSGKIISELDWEDPSNIYALALDDYDGDLERRAIILMGD